MMANGQASKRGSNYDVVIAGASFAGLAVAQRVAPHQSSRHEARGTSVLLLDQSPIGDGVTSACGAPLSIVHAMGADASVQQVHHEIVIHTPGSTAVWPLPEPFCTFDYRPFCELAFARTGAEFRQASVLGRTGPLVHTTAGDVSGRFLVDASGWRTVLTGRDGHAGTTYRWKAFGVETEVRADALSGLHFYFVPEIADGYAWVFPAGGTSRIGVISYRGRTKLRGALQLFLDRFGLEPATYHGGFLTSDLQAPVIDDIYVVGDAAGQCLPVTGEGIRTAILAGHRCGELIHDVLRGAVAERAARRAYAGFAARFRRRYRALFGMNAALLALPIPLRGAVAAIVGHPRLLRSVLRPYLGIFSDQTV